MPHRKVFISILGTGNYGSCQYTQGDFTSSDTHFIQKATLEFLNVKETWTAQDIAYIFLTPTARTSNWQEKPVNWNKEEKGYRGLAPILEEMKLPCPIETVDITEDGDEQGLWSVFQTIYDKLQEGDELYIDITHSFRYLPMLLLVLCNYAKFLKQTKVVHISYGNYEAKAPVKPLVDLMPLVEVQNWTLAASDFLRNGRTSILSELASERITPILQKKEGSNEAAISLNQFREKLDTVSLTLTTIRGKRIVDGSIFQNLSKAIKKLDASLIKPMVPLIDRVRSSFEPFEGTPNFKNGFVAAQWCYDKQLYQQSITILQETLKGYTAYQAGYNFNKEFIDVKFYLEMAGKAFYIATQEDQAEEKWDLGLDSDNIERGKSFVRKCLKLPIVKELSGLYGKIGRLRNDFNHAGFRGDATGGQKIPAEIKDLLDQVSLWIEENGDATTPHCESSTPLFLNLSNHSSDKWNKAQLDAARAYGEVVDMPFPEIDPGATTEEIHRLAEEYADRITSSYLGRDLMTVHLMGEMTFTFRLVTLLHARGVRCVASTTQRKTSELADGKKESIFEFQAFREY